MTGKPVRRRRLNGRCSLCSKNIDPSCQWCIGRAERLRPSLWGVFTLRTRRAQDIFV